MTVYKANASTLLFSHPVSDRNRNAITSLFLGNG